MEVPAKYGLVRAIALIVKIIAWIVLIIAIVGGILSIFNLGSGLGTWIGLGTMLEGLLVFLALFAIGSILSVLVDIEQGTRALSIRSRN